MAIDLKEKIKKAIDSRADDDKFLNKIYSVIEEYDEEDVYQLSDEEKQDINEALEDSKNGKFRSHKEVMQRSKERYPSLFK